MGTVTNPEILEVPVTWIRLIFCPILILGGFPIEERVPWEIRVMSEPESATRVAQFFPYSPNQTLVMVADDPRKAQPAGLDINLLSLIKDFGARLVSLEFLRNNPCHFHNAYKI